MNSRSNAQSSGCLALITARSVPAPRLTRPALIQSKCPLELPSKYGKINHMKKTLNVDDELFEEAKTASGAGTDTETVRLGLQALVRSAADERLRALRGSEPGAQDVARRREKAVAERKRA